MRNYILATALIAASGSSIAQNSYKVGDWSVTSAGEITVASTTNSSGSVVGYLCVGSTCGPYLSNSTDCEEKVVSPILINSPVGATHASTTCTTIGVNKYHLINEVSDFNQALEGGGEIGFAFPMQDGKFHVTRFSTAGAVPAIKDVIQKATGKKSTKLRADETL